MRQRRFPRRAVQPTRRFTAELLEDRRMLYGMTTGPGDGGLDVEVDGFGAFGYASGGSAGEAVYDPVGPLVAASTTFESGIAIRFGNSGPRQFLASGSINGSGGQGDPVVSGTSTIATSTFTVGALSFELLQAVASMSEEGVRTGSLLSQNYTIRNPTNAPVSFEIIRYIDGDLLFDGTLVDGGGRIADADGEFLFETDAGGTGQTDTTFLGIDTFGGQVPASGRFEIERFNQLAQKIIDGESLDDTITNDSNNDGFVDANSEYDVTLAVRNVFTLAPGQSVIYVTRTIFGSGVPDDVFLGLPDVTVDDAAQFEGDAGLTDMLFNVNLSEEPLSPVIVVYNTADLTAVAPGEYLPTSGTLTFLPGEATSQQITVQIVGDSVAEANETFLLQLSQVTGGLVERGEAIGTILNDEVELSVSDVTEFEGTNIPRMAVFTVTAIGDVNGTATVSYFTGDITATAASDYLPRSGGLTFSLGSNTRLVTVPILGDTFHESSETFGLYLTNAVGTGVDIVDSPGIGTILDDDPIPALYVNDVHVTTTEAGLLTAVFTVALDRPSGQNVAVNFATVDNTAISGIDYVGLSGGLVFAPGVTTLSVTVPILTSSQYAANKTFLLNLLAPVNAIFGDPQGIGRIIFAPPPVNEFIIDDGDPLYSRSGGGWTNLTNTLAYNLDYDYRAAGNGSGQATWNFDNIPQGTYQVLAKWIPFSNRATNAPYTILDGSTPLGTVLVNQQLFPTGDQSNGITWQSLGMFSTSTGILRVRLGDNANGYVIADAIRLVRDGISVQVPEMDVAAFGRSVSTGDVTPALEDGTDFGVVASQSSSVTHTFNIANNGNAPLHLTGLPRVEIWGAHAGDFTVVTQPSATVAAGYGATFQIQFHPSAEGLRQAIVSIANDDDSEHPYLFHVQGTGAAAGPSQFIIDDQGSGFLKSPNWATNENTYGYGNSVSTVAGGNGSNWARWTFGGLAPGEYDVYATWVAFGNRASNAPFTLADGNASQHVFQVNQQQWPSTPINGTNWGAIGSIDVTTGELKVSLTNAANGYVVADAVMIVRRNAPAMTLMAHNATMPLDVNGDRRVSSFDALLVVNQLLTAGSAVPQAVPLTSSLTTGAGFYRDVNGDGQISPRDALMVISHLLTAPAAAPQATTATIAEPAAVLAVSADAANLAAIDAALSRSDSSETRHEPIQDIPQLQRDVVPTGLTATASEKASRRALEFALADLTRGGTERDDGETVDRLWED